MGEQRTILVTGGSAGIGAAVGRAKRGWRVAIGARGSERLENVTRERVEAGVDLENLAEGLAQELEGTGVRVTSLRVGPTLTESGDRWTREEVMTYPAYRRGFGLRDARLLGALLTADAVAEAVIRTGSRPPGVWLGNLEIQPEAPTEAR